MRRRSSIGFLLILAGACALAAFALIGSTVDADGVLHEPFPLLPTGCALISVGVFAVAVRALRRPPGQK
jgi:hypothetical protein